MKIDATTSIYAAQRYRMIANKTVFQDTAKQGKDDIEISNEAVSFARAFSAARMELEKPAGMDARVGAIRSQVAAGSYTVKPEAIADSILMFEGA